MDTSHDMRRAWTVTLLSINPLLLVSMLAFPEGDNPMKIEIDKGEVSIQFRQQSSSVEMNWRPTPGCKATVEMSQNGDSFVVRHSDQPCPQGAQIQLFLRLGESVDIEHNGGVISIKGSSRLVTAYSKIAARVSGGVINSEVSEIIVEGQYAPALAKFNRSGSSGEPYINLDLQGGVINFLD